MNTHVVCKAYMYSRSYFVNESLKFTMQIKFSGTFLNSYCDVLTSRIVIFFFFINLKFQASSLQFSDCTG